MPQFKAPQSDLAKNAGSANNAEVMPNLRDSALCAAIEQALMRQAMPTTEHALLKHAERQGALAEVLAELGILTCDNSAASAANGAMLNLFYQHFLVQHCLYLLRREYLQQELGLLLISPTKIQLFDTQSAGPNSPSTSLLAQQESEQPAPALEAYYLDLSNLNKESDASISEMLSGFWRKYATHQAPEEDELERALAEFSLTLPIDMAQLRSCYRSRVQAAHPDRGGSHEDFLKLQHAYETLRQYVNYQSG